MTSFSTPPFLPAPSALVLALAIGAHAAPLASQSLAFSSRIGQTTAYCGASVGGPGALHTFLTGAPTNDLITVSDPGAPNVTHSEASSQVSTLLTPTSLSIAIVGSSSRGPLTGFGVNATADARENWIITLSATSHFTLNVVLDATSSEPATMPPLTFFLVPWGAGASITPDAGTPPSPYSFSLVAPGSFSLTASGTMTAGDYAINLAGRMEGSSFAYPFVGGYAGSLALGIATTAAVSTRNAGTNPASFSCNLPTLGQTWQGTVDLATTSHDSAALFGALAPASIPLPGGQTVLLAGSLLVLGPVLTGTQVTFSLAIPPAPDLAGFLFFTQALHFGGAPDFALSNANDLTLGF
ncbi:MAG: hypothetical protein JNK78_03325 [Planctomycetes bacterium]|nr:hypothetical protein [Planctomycetota bacterium]